MTVCAISQLPISKNLSVKIVPLVEGSLHSDWTAPHHAYETFGLAVSGGGAKLPYLDKSDPCSGIVLQVLRDKALAEGQDYPQASDEVLYEGVWAKKVALAHRGRAAPKYGVPCVQSVTGILQDYRFCQWEIDELGTGVIRIRQSLVNLAQVQDVLKQTFEVILTQDRGYNTPILLLFPTCRVSRSRSPIHFHRRKHAAFAAVRRDVWDYLCRLDQTVRLTEEDLISSWLRERVSELDEEPIPNTPFSSSKPSAWHKAAWKVSKNLIQTDEELALFCKSVLETHKVEASLKALHLYWRPSYQSQVPPDEKLGAFLDFIRSKV